MMLKEVKVIVHNGFARNFNWFFIQRQLWLLVKIDAFDAIASKIETCIHISQISVYIYVY